MGTAGLRRDSTAGLCVCVFVCYTRFLVCPIVPLSLWETPSAVDCGAYTSTYIRDPVIYIYIYIYIDNNISLDQN